MDRKPHPHDPRSNVNKFGGYDPNNYILDNVSLTVKTNECLIPQRPPCLTQRTVGMFLQPLTRELVEVPPRPTIDELPDAVIDHMVDKDKAFWVDKPGANAYTLHDAYYNFGITTEMVMPEHSEMVQACSAPIPSYQLSRLYPQGIQGQYVWSQLSRGFPHDVFLHFKSTYLMRTAHQDVFPRSYQYDLDCVRYRRLHACDALKHTGGKKKPLRAQCRDCRKLNTPGLTPFQLAWAKDPGQKRWRYYPDLNENLSLEKIREMMEEVGRPFKNEACNWYYKNYPSTKHDIILRKFSK